jgi:hypothetical protein
MGRSSPDLLDRELEELLLRVLASDQASMRSFAAQALGVAGTIAAVPALSAVVAGRGDAELWQIAETAIAQIQARAPSAERGGLALIPDQAGAVSLAADRGAVSLPDQGPSES